MAIQFIEITVGFAIFAIIHSVLAATGVQNFVETKVPALHRCYRLVYTLISVVSLGLLILLLPPTGKLLYALQPPISWIFRAIQLAAAFFFLLALRDFNTGNFLGLDCLKKSRPSQPEQLTVSGLFQYCRHPMYLASTIFLLAQPQMNSGMLAYTLNIILYLLVGSIFEEKRLEKTFGPAYVEYKKQVPKFLPRFRKGQNALKKPGKELI